MGSLTNSYWSPVSAGTRIWRWPRARIGPASCRHASLPATMRCPRGLIEGATAAADIGVFFECAEYHFYSALSRAASCESAAAGQWQEHVRHWPRTTDSSRSGRRLARTTSRTALPRRAEIARIEAARSMPNLYEQAIISAQATALSTTRRSPRVAARFYTARGFEQIAHLYLRNARDCIPALGSRRQGAPTRCDVSAPQRWKSLALLRQARSASVDNSTSQR